MSMSGKLGGARLPLDLQLQACRRGHPLSSFVADSAEVPKSIVQLCPGCTAPQSFALVLCPLSFQSSVHDLLCV